MRWKISHRGHDPRQIDLIAILALLITAQARPPRRTRRRSSCPAKAFAGETRCAALKVLGLNAASPAQMPETSGREFLRANPPCARLLLQGFVRRHRLD